MKITTIGIDLAKNVFAAHRGDTVSDVTKKLCCACSSLGRRVNWFTLYGLERLKSLPPGRGRRWPFEQICALLRQSLGTIRSIP